MQAAEEEGCDGGEFLLDNKMSRAANVLFLLHLSWEKQNKSQWDNVFDRALRCQPDFTAKLTSESAACSRFFNEKQKGVD